MKDKKGYTAKAFYVKSYKNFLFSQKFFSQSYLKKEIRLYMRPKFIIFAQKYYKTYTNFPMLITTACIDM